MLRTAFGGRVPTKLADPRLEALRRYAVLYRLSGGLIDPQAEADCLSLGCTEQTLCQIETSLRSALPGLRDKPRRNRPAIFAIAAAIFLVSMLWLASVFDDMAVAAMVTCLGAVLTLSLAAGRPSSRQSVSGI